MIGYDDESERGMWQRALGGAAGIGWGSGRWVCDSGHWVCGSGRWVSVDCGDFQWE